MYKSKIVLFLHLDLIKNLISPNIRTPLGEERVPRQESYQGATHQLVRQLQPPTTISQKYLGTILPCPGLY